MVVYRDEIDGLRAIAVISVILYHAGFKMFFSGGYVGVDIFFVISGYLITSIINRECQQETFSLIHFYERRCRRILPVLFFILFLSSILAYYFMLPEQLKEFGESLISVLCLSSNIYFWWKDDGYFSRLTDLNPLVHTWSLAVEEQFYLIFPLLCYLFLKKKFSFIISLISIGLISLFLSQWSGNLQLISLNQFQIFYQSSYASFYLPIGRIWELLLGVFVAFYLPTDDSPKAFSTKLNQLCSLIGFILIIVCIVFFDDHYIPPFPNFYTLIPTFGTTLILIYGEKTTLVGYLLSRCLLRWIGLISYSAYLWHQPLFSFIRLQSNQTLPMSTIILIILIIFSLSLLSYFFIEQPFRNKQYFSQKQIFSYASLAAVIILMIGLFLINNANSRSSLSNNVDDSFLLDLKKHGNRAYVGTAFMTLSTKTKFSNRTATLNRRIALVGDSFAQDFYNMIIEGEHLRNYEFCVYFIVYHCQIYLGNEDRGRFLSPGERASCKNVYDIKYALSIIHQADIVILASRWKQWSVERLPTTIQFLNLTNNQQLFILGTKHFGVVNPKFYVDKSNKYRIKHYQYPLTEAQKINNLLEKTLNKTIFVNIQKMICTGLNQTCPIFTPNGKLITYDGVHLTKYGAIYLGDIIFNNKPLNQLK